MERRINDRIEAIRGIDLFRDLDDGAVRSLAEDARAAMFAPGETVIRSGDAGDTMFLVIRGLLSVRLGANGAETEAARLIPGSFFGEMSLLTGSPRQATVVAVESCELLEIDHDAFHRLLSSHPDVAQKVSVKVMERRRENLATVEAPKVERKAVLVQERDDLVDKIKSFFGLGRPSDQ
jgi:CRP-like cAMP-binding protein